MTSFNPAAFRAFAAAIGKDYVMTSEDDKIAYSDHFAADEEKHRPAGAISPANAEEVREVVRIANQYKVPLWPISRGKNFGYGGSAPVMKGAVVLDLSRMKKIEMDRENGVVLVEPGVGFFDLYDYLQTNKIPLWLSVPGQQLGFGCGQCA